MAFLCNKFPCAKVNNLSKQYTENYGINLIQNGLSAREDMSTFLSEQAEPFTCKVFGSIY